MAQIGWIIISWWTFSSGVLSLALQDFLDMVRVFLLFKKKKTILKTKKLHTDVYSSFVVLYS